MKEPATRTLLFLLTIISRCSWRNIYRLSDTFRFLIFDVIHYRRRVIMANLHNSFPGEKEEVIQKIARRYYRNFTDIVFETIKLKSISKTDLLRRFEFDTTVLDHYYEQKKNLVVVAIQANTKK